MDLGITLTECVAEMSAMLCELREVKPAEARLIGGKLEMKGNSPDRYRIAVLDAARNILGGLAAKEKNAMSKEADALAAKAKKQKVRLHYAAATAGIEKPKGKKGAK